ncbi:MAG: hypothetical protein GXO73_07875 [Calditrichaeota bacterium]|nr:hypothetical protein [Calditrichota bacterium]
MLNEGEDLAGVLEQLKIAESTWYRWWNQYGWMKAAGARHLEELKAENTRLKKLFAELELDRAMLKELAEGRSDPGSSSPCRFGAGETVRGV